MNNVTNYLKKHLLDIVLIFIVFSVFFASSSNDQEINTEIKISENEVPEPSPEKTPETERTTSLENKRPAESNTSNPYSNLTPKNNQNTITNNQTKPEESLNKSFEQIKGGSVSTEAIIERNTYFKKLSEQLRDLQGEVDSESSKESPDDKETVLPDDGGQKIIYDDFAGSTEQEELTEEQLEEEIYQELIEEMDY